jgi:hypothetical protein
VTPVTARGALKACSSLGGATWCPVVRRTTDWPDIGAVGQVA